MDSTGLDAKVLSSELARQDEVRVLLVFLACLLF